MKILSLLLVITPFSDYVKQKEAELSSAAYFTALSPVVGSAVEPVGCHALGFGWCLY